MAKRTLSAERPGRGDEFVYDAARHLAAYLHARDLAQDRDVLDAGCGEGFGTVLLADRARSVLGVDYSEAAVAAARAAYARPNLTFRRLDALTLGTLDGSFDLITSFQMIEHLREPARFVAGVRGRLRPDGLFMLTTPNRLTTVSENPAHVREYTAEELATLLRPHFSRIAMGSTLGDDKVLTFEAERARQVGRILRLDPLGLRRFLPRPLVHFAFARLGALVRRRIGVLAPETRAIGPEDLRFLAESRPDALDLVAFCRP